MYLVLRTNSVLGDWRTCFGDFWRSGIIIRSCLPPEELDEETKLRVSLTHYGLAVHDWLEASDAIWMPGWIEYFRRAVEHCGLSILDSINAGSATHQLTV